VSTLNLRAGCTAASKEKMQKCEEPSCPIDFWMQDTLRKIEESKVNRVTSQRSPPTLKLDFGLKRSHCFLV